MKIYNRRNLWFKNEKMILTENIILWSYQGFKNVMLLLIIIYKLYYSLILLHPSKIKTNNKLDSPDIRCLHANRGKSKVSFVIFLRKMLRAFDVSEGWSCFAAVCPKWRGERNRSNSNLPEISVYTTSLKKAFTRSILLVNDTSKFCTAIFARK